MIFISMDICFIECRIPRGQFKSGDCPGHLKVNRWRLVLSWISWESFFFLSIAALFSIYLIFYSSDIVFILLPECFITKRLRFWRFFFNVFRTVFQWLRQVLAYIFSMTRIRFRFILTWFFLMERKEYDQNTLCGNF